MAQISTGDEDEEGAAAEGAKKQEEALKEYTEQDLEGFDADRLASEIAVIEDQIKQMKPNLAAIREYYKKENEYLARVAELEAITAQRDAIRSEFEVGCCAFIEPLMVVTASAQASPGHVHGGLQHHNTQAQGDVPRTFAAFCGHGVNALQMITLGGDAELELVDNLNPFSEGIVFSVRPHKKSWKNISNLSGGEKTLSSLHHYKPTPLYVMDEIDAALDFRNVSIVGNYIKASHANFALARHSFAFP